MTALLPGEAFVAGPIKVHVRREPDCEDMPSPRDVSAHGMRAAQTVMPAPAAARIEEVDELDPTGRDAVGFGHTGH